MPPTAWPKCSSISPPVTDRQTRAPQPHLGWSSTTLNVAIAHSGVDRRSADRHQPARIHLSPQCVGGMDATCSGARRMPVQHTHQDTTEQRERSNSKVDDWRPPVRHGRQKRRCQTADKTHEAAHKADDHRLESRLAQNMPRASANCSPETKFTDSFEAPRYVSECLSAVTCR